MQSYQRGHSPQAWLSGACLSGLVIKVPCDRALVQRHLESAGRVTLGGDERKDPTYPVYCELWNVHDGGLRIGDVDQHDVAELAGEAMGALLGALAGAWTSALRGVPPPSHCQKPDRQDLASTVAQGRRAGARVLPSLWRSWSQQMAASLGTYRELCVWVPSVYVAGFRDAHSFVLGMLTDGKLATFADVAFGYGFDKRRARLDVVSPHEFSVSMGTNDSVLSFSPKGRAVRSPDLSELTVLEELWARPFLGVTRSGRFARSWLLRSLSSATLLETFGGELRAMPGFFPGGRARYLFADPTKDGAWHVLRFENVRADISYPTRL